MKTSDFCRYTRGLQLGFVAALGLAVGGCSHAVDVSALPNEASSAGIPVRDQNVQPGDIPAAWQCFPFGKQGKRPPADASEQASWRPDVDPMIANGCTVAGAREKEKLQKLAIALLEDIGGGTYRRYCTGTPIRFDPTSGVGFVVSAAHCVLDAEKPAGQAITPDDISIFRNNKATIYQGLIGTVTDKASLTGQINAVYVPSRYCKEAPMNGGCRNLEKQNGDIAVLKIVVDKGKTLGVLPDLQLAPKTLVIDSAQSIMALGYGFNEDHHLKHRDQTELHYVDYQFFATDAYKTVHSEASLMNGYFIAGRNKCIASRTCYIEIICGGDSGGGDFYWDGSRWDLIGAHSFGGSGYCGGEGLRAYGHVADVSADVRPFTAWIEEILRVDTAPTGCARLDDKYVCRARHD